MLKGFRTIIFNAAMTLGAGGTIQFSDLPPEAQHWLTLIVMAWGLIAIFFRLITSTPIGQRAVAEVGLSQADLNSIHDVLNEAIAAMPATVAAVQASVATIPAQFPATSQSLAGTAPPPQRSSMRSRPRSNRPRPCPPLPSLPPPDSTLNPRRPP